MTPTTLTDVLPLPVTFCAYRHGYLYVAQRDQVLVLDPARNVTVHALDFEPTRLSSYGGRVCLLHPASGAAQFSGAHLTAQFTAEPHTPAHFSAPLGLPVRNKLPLVPGTEWVGEDVMGMPVMYRGKVTHCPLTGRSYYDPLLGAQLSHDSLLTFARSTSAFAELGGVPGELLYAEAESLPDQLIPYSYARQNLHGAGMHGGFVFTPDSGRSWRKRSLLGFGVLTEKAVLSVSAEQGVRMITGSWG